MQRKEQLITGEIYHIYTKSIADFKVFTSRHEFTRIINMLRYFQTKNASVKFSQLEKLNEVKEKGFNKYITSISRKTDKLVQIIAFCIMPTHVHILLKQLKENAISNFMGNILNSYSRYFNLKHKRKGPLWEGKFKNVLVDADDQLLHLTRYIHLNPTTAKLVDKPEQWLYSSYREYIGIVTDEEEKICEYNDVLDIAPNRYKDFVKNRITYQQELGRSKRLLLEEPIYTPGV